MVEFDADKLLSDTTLTVTVHYRRLWRVKLGLALIKLGVRVTGMRCVVVDAPEASESMPNGPAQPPPR